MSHPNLEAFFVATRSFARQFGASSHDVLRGVTDGKAVGTYVEHAFQEHLITNGVVTTLGSSAKGIDLPALDIDIKVTSIRQPQSSSPFKSYKQKVEGLGYNLILFVYEKQDRGEHCFIAFRSVRFIPWQRTADFITTRGIRDIIDRGGNADDIFAFLIERMLPVDEITLAEYAKMLLQSPPRLGYLTISNALQWRLQYQRVITESLDEVVNLDSDGAGQSDDR